MKTRNGFVSNSSSASFILRTKNINSVASYMLDTIIREFKDWDSENSNSKKLTKVQKEAAKEYRTWERNLRKAYKISNIQSGKIGITLPFYDYDTYIVKQDNSIYVSTCSNVHWDFDASSIFSGEGAGSNNDRVHKIIENLFFYNIKNGLIHSVSICPEEKDRPYCNICKEKSFSYVKTMDGEMLCSQCYQGKFGKTPEKLLEELQESSKKNMTAFKHLEP